MKNYFITGTDTEIGKTFATCALIHAITARGITAPMTKAPNTACS